MNLQYQWSSFETFLNFEDARRYIQTKSLIETFNFCCRFISMSSRKTFSEYGKKTQRLLVRQRSNEDLDNALKLVSNQQSQNSSTSEIEAQHEGNTEESNSFHSKVGDGLVQNVIYDSDYQSLNEEPLFGGERNDNGNPDESETNNVEEYINLRIRKFL